VAYLFLFPVFSKTPSPEAPDGERARAMGSPKRNPEASGETDEAAAADEIPEVFREVFLFQKTFAKFGEGAVLDLADALPGDVELFADLLKGAFLAIAQPEAELENLQFPRVEEVEATTYRIAKIILGVFLGRIHGLRVG